MAVDRDRAVALLNHILEAELAGVVRYTHYAFMVYGHGRIPIVHWLEKQAEESIVHARRAGEMITHLGGHPSLGIGPLLESHRHDIDAILRESLDHEKKTLAAYYELLDLSRDGSVLLEEYARELIVAEEMHADAVEKMLRNSGRPD